MDTRVWRMCTKINQEMKLPQAINIVKVQATQMFCVHSMSTLLQMKLHLQLRYHSPHKMQCQW